MYTWVDDPLDVLEDALSVSPRSDLKRSVSWGSSERERERERDGKRATLKERVKERERR